MFRFTCYLIGRRKETQTHKHTRTHTHTHCRTNHIVILNQVDKSSDTRYLNSRKNTINAMQHLPGGEQRALRVSYVQNVTRGNARSKWSNHHNIPSIQRLKQTKNNLFLTFNFVGEKMAPFNCLLRCSQKKTFYQGFCRKQLSVLHCV